MTPDAAGEMLHNIFAAPAEPGPPYTHTFSPLAPDPAEAVAWLRKQIEATKRAASPKILREGGGWHIDSEQWEAGSGIIDAAGRPAAVAIGDYAAAHIVTNDPLSVLARCEAELAILDACIPDASMDTAVDDGDISAEEYVSTEAMGAVIIRLLAAGYRHREGYARFWGTPVTHTLTEDGQ